MNSFIYELIDRKLFLNTGTTENVVNELLNRRLIMLPSKKKTNMDLINKINSKFMQVNSARVNGQGVLKNALHQFYEQYGDYTDEEILNAIDLYLENINDGKYLRSPANFIYKVDENGLEDSLLLNFLKMSSDDKPQDFTKFI